MGYWDIGILGIGYFVGMLATHSVIYWMGYWDIGYWVLSSSCIHEISNIPIPNTYYLIPLWAGVSASSTWQATS